MIRPITLVPVTMQAALRLRRMKGNTCPALNPMGDMRSSCLYTRRDGTMQAAFRATNRTRKSVIIFDFSIGLHSLVPDRQARSCGLSHTLGFRCFTFPILVKQLRVQICKKHFFPPELEIYSMKKVMEMGICNEKGQ